MNLEVIKSYTLAILVGISLILTFSLWSHTPNETELEEEQLLDSDDLDLGGTEETRGTLVQPSQIIFSKFGDNHFGFANPEDQINLYQDMTSWVLYNFRESDANGRPNVNDDYLVEIIFPVELPVDIIPNLFTVNNPEGFIAPENMYFQRIYITRSKSDQSMTFSFLTTDGKKQLRAEVNNTQKYELLDGIISSLSGLEEYLMLESSGYPLFVPIEKTNMHKYTLRIERLPYTVLKNALFPDPASVIENVTADQILWYLDGPRSMQIFGSDRMNMEYIWAEGSIRAPMTVLEILDRSISSINGFKGWPHDYQLEDVNTSTNDIQYMMYYNGYPVFNSNNLSVIEQRLASNGVVEHRQPLYTLDFSQNESYAMRSGIDVINTLKSENSIYKLSDIQDIRVGYRLSHQTSADYINLTPAWYIKINDRWQQLIMDEKIPSKGVS